MNRHLLLAALLLPAAACSRTEAPAPAQPAAGSPASTAPATAATAATAQLQLPNLGQPAPGVYTSGRLQQDDIARLKAAGIRHVVDLTQDSETPDFDEAAAMREAGIAYDNLPIAGADALTRDNVEAFDRLVAGAGTPLLVHCASSNRVGAMAALRAAWLQGKPLEAALAEGRAWGLSSMEPAVRARLAAAE